MIEATLAPLTGAEQEEIRQHVESQRESIEMLAHEDIPTFPPNVLDEPTDNTLSQSMYVHYELNKKTIVRVSDTPVDTKPYKTELCHCEWTPDEAETFALAVLDQVNSEIASTGPLAEAFEQVAQALRDSIMHGKQPW